MAATRCATFFILCCDSSSKESKSSNESIRKVRLISNEPYQYWMQSMFDELVKYERKLFQYQSYGLKRALLTISL